jgi:RNA polymerase sigma factor (sigma-70 family)
MEGRGFLQAAHANPNISALIVRGISDLLTDKSRTDRAGYQERAAEHASAFAFEILARLEAPKEEIDEYILVLTATIAEVDRPRAEAIVAHLRELTGDARLTLKRLEEGSVRLVVEGSREGFDLLKAMAEAGRLSGALGVDVASLLWISEDGVSKERSDLEEAVAVFLPKAKAASREAINGLFEAVYPFIRRIAQLEVRRRSPSRTWADAEDLVLEALIRAYRRLESFQGTTAEEFLVWMKVLMQHLAMDSMRMAYRRSAMADTDAFLDAADASLDVVETMERAELMQTVQRAMEGLHEKDRVIIRMYYFEETPLLDIAKALNLSPSVHRFGTGPAELCDLTAAQVVRSVQRLVPSLCRKRAKVMTSALRSFLRYARYQDFIRSDLAACVPCVADWSVASIPKGLPIELLQVSRDRLPDIGWYGKLRVAGTFASQGEPPGFPIEVLQGEGRHFACSQPKTCQQQQDRVVASANGTLPIATGQHSFDMHTSLPRCQPCS